MTHQVGQNYACHTLLIAQYLREVRVKVAALLAANSFSARTGIFRRQTYTVHRFQTRFALTFIVLSALHTTVSAMVVYQILGGPQSGIDLAAGMARLTSLEPQAVRLFSTLLILAMASYAVLYFIIVVSTHRVAGPIALMQKQLDSLLAGRYPSFRSLRRHDELKDFFEQLRLLVEQLQTNDAEESKVLQQVWDCLRTQPVAAQEQVVLASLQKLIDAKRRALEGSKRGELEGFSHHQPSKAPAGVASQ